MIIIITISFRNSEAERWSRKPWVERSILSEGNVTLNFPADGNKSIKTEIIQITKLGCLLRRNKRILPIFIRRNFHFNR